MSTFLDKIDRSRIPKHIAIIMDGNGRWAKRHNRPRVFGHRNGVKAVREVTEGAAELGVKHLTLYAFSKENWKRPQAEVNTLMSLFVRTVGKELKTLNKNKIRLKAIGDLNSLPQKTYKALTDAIEDTSENDHMDLILALNYSSRWELTDAVRRIGSMVKEGRIASEEISEETVSENLSTAGIPDPELMIRTSGEMRISNFLLWQLSYAELYFTETLWPDFRKEDLNEAILTYQSRERRFGMTGDQVNKVLNRG